MSADDTLLRDTEAYISVDTRIAIKRLRLKGRYGENITAGTTADCLEENGNVKEATDVRDAAFLYESSIASNVGL